MRSYFYSTLLLLACILSSIPTQATHWRGGYINYTLDEQNPMKANFTMTAYTNSSSPADDPIVHIHMGDGNILVVNRFSITPIDPNIDVNLYKWEYTFPSAGTYTTVFNGENRNGGILNLAAPTDQISFAIETTVKIKPLNSNRHGVQIKQPLSIIAYSDTPLRFNLLAYDLDGDSLGYKLIAPLYQNSQGVITSAPGYTAPAGFGINQFGEIYWEKPSRVGEYNYAVQITQYQKGVAVGHTVFDMQFLVLANNTTYGIPQFTLVNQDELTFLKDGRLLVKPGEKVKLRLDFLQPASRTWDSELKEKSITDISFQEIDPFVTEFSFTATKDLTRRQAYGINFNYGYREHHIPTIYNVTFTLPILIWEPEPIALVLQNTSSQLLTPEGYISSTPGSAVKLLAFAQNGLGHEIDLAVETNLKSGAKHFSFVTRDSADSVVGELVFTPSEEQISSTPYTVTLRSSSMQLRTSNSPVVTKEVTYQVLVATASPLSADEGLASAKVKVYPNPAKRSITINATRPRDTFSLYAADGRLVYQAKVGSGENHISLPAELKPGLYTYSLGNQAESDTKGRLMLL